MLGIQEVDQIKALIQTEIEDRNASTLVYDRLPDIRDGKDGFEGEIRLSFDRAGKAYLSAFVNKKWHTEEINMADFNPKPWYLRVAEGEIPGYSLIHKFGAGTLTTTMSPITNAGTYQTPSTVQALEVVSDNANDTAAGTGAQEVTLIGLDSSWNEVTVVKELNGTTAVALGANRFRMYRWYVSRSGVYADESTGSHAGILTLQGTGGGTVWDTMPVTPFPVGQSQIGVVTIPDGYEGRLLSKNIFVDSSKTADIYFFKREHTDDVTTPFSGTMRLVEREVGISGGYALTTVAPKGPFTGPCDVGFMGVMSVGTSECSVEFEMLLKKI
jgi:hypothetical protein